MSQGVDSLAAGEQNCPMRVSCPSCSAAPIGRMRHSPLEILDRHCHSAPYAALVLRGTYLEAGDTGRRMVEPGDVLTHGGFEGHINRFDARGAEVLVLPLDSQSSAHWRVADPDAIARLAEQSIEQATSLLRSSMVSVERRSLDWPDRLARDISRDPRLCLGAWASSFGLRQETVSRGFRLAYGCTPASFRSAARARAAWREVRHSARPLVDIALDKGFADQAHMTRAIRALTGRSPRAWRDRGLGEPGHAPVGSSQPSAPQPV